MSEGFVIQLWQAFKLILSGDKEFIRIVILSLMVSGAAVSIAAFFGVPLGTYLGLKEGKAVNFLSKIVYTFMGLPPVVAGLAVFLLLSNAGPLGMLDLLWTPSAMVIAQFILALPIITGLTSSAVRNKDRAIGETAITLGANRYQVAWTIIMEARIAIVSAIIAGFGRVIAEVGAVMMVGGNIEGKTRVMTTAIVLETRKGNFEMALGLGIILLIIAFLINSLLLKLQWKG